MFVTRVELDAEMGDRAANNVWKRSCYHLAVKESGPWMMAPFTKAEASAAWANRSYSWDDCQRYWDELPLPGMQPRKICIISRNQLRARLQELVTV